MRLLARCAGILTLAYLFYAFAQLFFASFSAVAFSTDWLAIAALVTFAAVIVLLSLRNFPKTASASVLVYLSLIGGLF